MTCYNPSGNTGMASNNHTDNSSDSSCSRIPSYDIGMTCYNPSGNTGMASNYHSDNNSDSPCSRIPSYDIGKPSYKPTGKMASNKKKDTMEYNIIYSATCDVCEISDQPIKYHCKECEHYLCEVCNDHHKKIKACNNHNVQSLETISKLSKDKLQNLAVEYEKAILNVETKISDVEKTIEDIHKEELDQFDSLNMYTDDAINELKENKERLEQELKEENTKLVENQEKYIEILQEKKQELLSQAVSIEYFLTSQKQVPFSDFTLNVGETMESTLTQVTTSLPVVTCDVQIHVIRNNNVNVTDIIKIDKKEKINEDKAQNMEPLCMRNLLTIVTPIHTYADLCTEEYMQSARIKLKYWPESIQEINDMIWCGGNSVINVYNQDCEIESSFNLDFSYIRSFVYTNGHIIVGSGSGLDQMTINCTYQTKVALGCFASVCVFDGLLFALEYQKVIIKVYQYNNGWEKLRDINLHYKNGNFWDKLVVKSNTDILVSSWENKTIFVYTSEGKLKGEIQQGTNNVVLCGLDKDENMLLVDHTDRQVKVYDSKEKWHVVQVVGGIVCPINAFVDKYGNMWVGTSGKKKELTKYSML